MHFFGFFSKTHQAGFWVLLPLFFPGYFGLSCQHDPEASFPSPKGYDFSQGTKYQLPPGLREISGISFSLNDESLLYGVNDEHGFVYSIPLENPENAKKKIEFASKGDYEDICWYAGQLMVLRSDGVIFRIDSIGRKSSSTAFGVLPKGEYEGMASAGDHLYVICKSCKKDDPGTATIFKLKWHYEELILEENFQLSGIEKLSGKKEKGLNPSALARHPINGHWYMLSHLNKWLVIADSAFNPLEYIPLNPLQFFQPEGIAFSRSGDLFISNEGGKGNANILKFSYLDADGK